MVEDRTNGQAQWSAFIDTLAAGGAEVYRVSTPGRSVEEQSQVTQALIWALIAELQSLASIDRDHPRWLTLLNHEMRRFNSNADNSYEVAYIRGSGTYRIFGKRGTTKLMYLQVGAGTLGVGDLTRHKMLGDLNVDDCEIADDGTFEVILSPQRPTGYTGAWMQLDPTRDDSFVWVRQVSYDWLNEIDGQLSIMRRGVNQYWRRIEGMRPEAGHRGRSAVARRCTRLADVHDAPPKTLGTCRHEAGEVGPGEWMSSSEAVAQTGGQRVPDNRLLDATDISQHGPGNQN